MADHLDDLVHRATGGDPIAMDALFARYLPGLRAFVRLRAGPVVRAKEASTDIVQSVCREIIEQAHRFRYGGEAGFKRWLYRQALRKIADRREYYGAAKRDVGREDSRTDLLSCYRSFCTPSRHAAAREQIARVEQAFDRLPAKYRDVIVQAHVMGLSRAEIAAETGQSEGAVRTQLSRALARLAEILHDDVETV